MGQVFKHKDPGYQIGGPVPSYKSKNLLKKKVAH